MSYNSTVPLERTDTPIKVAVVTDDALLRSALASLLSREADLEVTSLAGADVALWDPGVDAAQVVDKLGELDRMSAPCLALLPEPPPELGSDYAQRVIGAGARGVILRERVGPHLLSALRAVRGGLTVLDPQLAGALVDRGPAMPPLAEALTSREVEVVQLLAEGLSNKQVAKELGISEHTAKFHIGRILEKLDAGTRTEAVVRALRYGLADL
ncbi:MAG: response regulator transcription factor [Polyangiaceae bacterium]